MMRNRDVMVSTVTSRAWKNDHNHVREMSTDVDHSKRLDSKNGNNFWIKVVEKDAHAVGKAFEILDEKSTMPVGHKKVIGHLVFDVKIDFTRKARWVLDGHKTHLSKALHAMSLCLHRT